MTHKALQALRGAHISNIASTTYKEQSTATKTKHISVCICSYRRPELLSRLLKMLADQTTNDLFTYSIVVADNDYLRSAEATVSSFGAASLIPVIYCVEPRQNIALARNKAVDTATGDYIAFIDDDELPIREWLLTLFRSCNKYDVDGVLGPVKPQFDEKPPKWVVKSNLYDRPTYSTGFVIDWTKGRTGNVLLKRQVFANGGQHFRPEFRTGEDQDFFKRVIEKGHVFVWCNEAVAYEVVPPLRWKRTFVLKRALLRGASARLQVLDCARLHPILAAVNITKSVLAVVIYTAALPLCLLLGYHRFMLLLIKLCDHLGKLLAFVGINPIREQYVTD